MFTIEDVEKIVFFNQKIDIDSLPIYSVKECYEFLKEFAKDKVIYGINTGFGPMAQWKVDDLYLTDLQYNIIRSHSTGMGNPIEDRYVKAVMIARLGTFLQARSGIHPDVIELLVNFINKGICPFIPEHGSVGASGDLVQLAHLALNLIGEGEVHYLGQWRNAAEVLKECDLKPMNIYIREGLSVTNGTSVMTGIGCINQIYAERLLNMAIVASVWINEIASSYDDFMSEGLNECRLHDGQNIIAKRMRELSSDSKCMLNREHFLYDSSHNNVKSFDGGRKLQAYYSLRCIPQILGPIYDTLKISRKVLDEELNSACDNPIIDPIRKNVFHGGNFHGDYISLEEDKVKIAIVRLVMTMERQLNYLLHDRINNILPPFLNMGVLGLNYGMQACQFTATSTTAECQTLSMPNYVHSIPNNNDNQDIVSMGTNTALLCKKVIENAWQVMSIHFMALAQATDCLGIKDKLSDSSKCIYDDIRNIVPTIKDDKVIYRQLSEVENYLKNKTSNLL